MKMKLHILLIISLLVMTSCGSKPEEPVVEPATVRYSAEFWDLGIVCDSFVAGCAGDTDGLVFLAVSRMDTELSPHHYLYSVSSDGVPSLILAADDFLVNGAEGFVQIKNLQTGADGSVWLNIYCLTSQYSGDYLWHVDQGGTELDRFKLNQPADGTLVDDNKWTYVVSGTTVSVLNQGQQLQFKLEAGGNTPPKPVRLSNGQAGFLVTRDDVSAEVRTVDTAAQDWGETYRLPKECVAVYPGSGEYLFFSTANQVLGGWNAERNSLVELVSWLETGVNTSALLGFSINADGQILAAANEASSAQLAMLTPGTDIPEKTVLTLAAISSNSYLREQVAQFNRTSTSCRIVLEQYYTQTGEWFSPDEFQQGMTRLLTELSAGKIPDLLYVDSLPVLQFGQMGMLEDLWPYIENDPELGREAVMEHVLECAEQDDELYMIFNAFRINTVVGSKAVVGDRTSWTLEDLRTALDTMPEGCAIFSPYSTKLETLRDIIYADLGSYVDWENGACSFDSEEFKDVLSFCNEMEAEQGGWAQWYTLVPEGQEMLLDDKLGNFIRIQEHEAIFGGEISYVGYPRSDGECGSSFIIINPIAMTTACKDKEGAWPFLRQFLLPQELPKDAFGDVDVSINRFPVSRESFEALLEESMKNTSTDKEDRPPRGTSFVSGGEVIFDLTYTPTTQAQYDQIMELYNAISTVYTEDSALWEIISEQAQPYFVGDKSVDEAARLIQSRAGLYVNERK